MGIETPQLGGLGKADDPFAFQAREFLRTTYNTKHIEFYIEHKGLGRAYGRAEFNGDDLATQLLL